MDTVGMNAPTVVKLRDHWFVNVGFFVNVQRKMSCFSWTMKLFYSIQ